MDARVQAAGNYPFPFGVEVGAVLQSYAGSLRYDHVAAGGEPVPGRPGEQRRPSC